MKSATCPGNSPGQLSTILLLWSHALHINTVLWSPGGRKEKRVIHQQLNVPTRKWYTSLLRTFLLAKASHMAIYSFKKCSKLSASLVPRREIGVGWAKYYAWHIDQRENSMEEKLDCNWKKKLLMKWIGTEIEAQM